MSLARFFAPASASPSDWRGQIGHDEESTHDVVDAEVDIEEGRDAL